MVPRDIPQSSNRFSGSAPDWIVNEIEGLERGWIFAKNTDLKSQSSQRDPQRRRRKSEPQTGKSYALNLGLAAIRERTQIREKEPWGTKKIGAESSDPNRHSQPRLPGSVVGEASMRLLRKSCKITEVTARKLRFEKMIPAGGWTRGEHLRGLKPSITRGVNGTVKAVPYPNPSSSEAHSGDGS
jgi:hypothetical protein